MHQVTMYIPLNRSATCPKQLSTGESSYTCEKEKMDPVIEDHNMYEEVNMPYEVLDVRHHHINKHPHKCPKPVPPPSRQEKRSPREGSRPKPPPPPHHVKHDLSKPNPPPNCFPIEGPKPKSPEKSSSREPLPFPHQEKRLPVPKPPPPPHREKSSAKECASDDESQDDYNDVLY